MCWVTERHGQLYGKLCSNRHFDSYRKFTCESKTKKSVYFLDRSFQHSTSFVSEKLESTSQQV